MQNNFKVAITGGIGSGKSVACDIIRKKGFIVFDLDKIYTELLRNEVFVKEICKITATEPIIDANGLTINRELISQKVYNDKNLLSLLNDFTHPAIMQEFLSRAEKHKGLLFCEVPLLYESGLEKTFDFVFVIKRKEQDRINSVILRDGKTKAQIKNVIKNQFDYAKLSSDEHTIFIENDSDTSVFAERIDFAIKKISK